MARGLILAVRHPRPIVGARICIGRTDVGLAAAPEGEAERLLAEVGEPIERIVSSPLSRALDVARALAQHSGAPLHADDRLTDQDFGSWEGKAWASLPRLETVAWQSDPIHYAPGGGESVSAMLRRVRHVWARLASSEDTTLVMTHAGPIQCLLHVAAALKLPDALARSVPFGAVIRLEGRL